MSTIVYGMLNVREINRRYEMNEKLQKLKELLAVQGQDGNWNYCEYMRGMYNGMELAVALMEGREPNYRDASDMGKDGI